MSIPTRFVSILPLMMVAACIPPGAGGGSGGGGGNSSGGMSSRCGSANYGASAAALKISTFLSAAGDFTARTAALETQMDGACRAMGAELGLSAGQLNGDMPTVCRAVSTKMREEMTAVRAEAGVQVSFQATPPRCTIAVNAYADCAARCDVNVDRGEVQVQCEGGQMVGQCSAQCSGECNVEVQGRCEGSCEGSCQGGCQGTCNGTCEGTCSSRGADGQCNGTCSGTCHGTCSGGCQGSCEGDCWVSGQASCTGECRGGCSVDYEAPRCTGTTRAPSVDADCQASCNASVQAEATCEPGRAELAVTGGASADVQARADRVRAAIRAGWSQFMLAAVQFRGLVDSGRALGRAAQNLRGTGRALLEAAACMTQAVAAIPASMAKVDVSVSVQVEMSASVSGSAG